jgi:WD40 repeat-containing protein SMU1
MKEINVDAGDVIQLMLQFCKENALTRTVQTLQEESQITLNIVEDMNLFTSDILAGRWDAVLKSVSQLSLPQSKMIDLYEQVMYNLIKSINDFHRLFSK